MDTTAKAALGLHIPNEPLFLSEYKDQQSTFLCQLLYHLEEEVVNSALQEPPGLFMSCCVVHTT